MNIGIVGLGLIGGSLGRAIVARTSDTVYATDISEDAMKIGALVKAYHHPLTKDIASTMDVVFFSLYPVALDEVLGEYAPLLKDGCIVCDCCGNKRRVVKRMKELATKYPHLNFVSTHPMAGREFSGVSHSTTTLFNNASMIIVPVSASIEKLAFIKEYSLKLGFGEVVMTTAERHDEIIAFTSQLAHIVSSSYIKSPRALDYMGFSAGSFRDMTRVARLSPDMWAQLTIDNADFLVEELEELITHLTEYKDALTAKDYAEVRALLADGNERKLTADKLKKVRNNG